LAILPSDHPALAVHRAVATKTEYQTGSKS